MNNIAHAMPDHSPRALTRAEPLAERVATAVRDSIVAGELAPGTHLSVPELSRRLGVSRTPAREALLILQREGLVGRRGSAGMQVLAGGLDALTDLLDLREVLEGLAARRAADRMEPTEREALSDLHRRHVEVLEQDDRESHVRLDTEFHALIRSGARSDLLAEQLERIDRIVQVLNRSLSHERGFDPHLVDLDHGAIIAAIVAGDGEAAETAARAHVARMRRFLKARSKSG